MLFADLPPGQQLSWAVAALLGISALILHFRERPKLSILVLTLAALVLRISAAFLDPFLNFWDEAFHAVAARNMMEHPLTPMLHHEPAMPITDHWPYQHIWLHKPPFFLWQMALSMKIFGTEFWAIRIPSAIWTALLLPATWRMGVLLSDRHTGFASAILVAFAYLLQELTAGSINTDHNDAVFIALVGCSLWALLEYLNNRHWRWAVAIGLLCAAAVLTKWYVGLLAFLPFGLVLIRTRFDRKLLIHFMLAVGITFMIAGAWVLHIHHWFPAEAGSEAGDNLIRLLTPFEGHRGSWTFHFDVIDDLVPPFTWWLIIPALIWLLIRVRTDHRIFLISVVGAVHLFFMIAQTKMVSYTIVLLPIYMLAIGHLLARLYLLIPSRPSVKWMHGALLVVVAYFAFDPSRIIDRHTIPENASDQHLWRQQLIAANESMSDLAALLETPGPKAIFNYPMTHHLEFMFTYRIPTWQKLPAEKDVEGLRQKGYTVYALQDGLDPDTFPAGVILIPDTTFSIPRIRRL